MSSDEDAEQAHAGVLLFAEARNGGDRSLIATKIATFNPPEKLKAETENHFQGLFWH